MLWREGDEVMSVAPAWAGTVRRAHVLADIITASGDTRTAELHDAVREGLTLLGRDVASIALPEVDPTVRHARGSYYTPKDLATSLVGGAVDVLRSDQRQDLEQAWVLDPACGSGAMLVVAAHQLAAGLLARWADDEALERAEEYGAPTPLLAALAFAADELVYGMDVDETAVRLAGLALDLLSPIRDQWWPRANVRVGDSLKADWVSEFPGIFEPRRLPDYMAGFAAVVSNPPYLGGQKISGALGADYRAFLVEDIAGGAKGSADLSAYFWLKMHALVADAGLVGILATNTLLQGATARVGRDQITHRGWRPYRLMPGATWPVKGVAVHYCTVHTSRMRWVPKRLRDVQDTLSPPP